MNASRIIPGPLGNFAIPADPAACSEVLATNLWAGEYDHPQLPRDGIRTLLDVGMNVGAFSAWAAARWPGVRIDGYEPNRDAAEYAELNLPDALVHRLAVCIDPDPTLNVHADWGCSSTRYSDMDRNVALKVPALHPRDLPAADVLKVDGEGVEPEVAEHYRHFPTLKLFMCEFHSPEDLKRIVRVVESHGMWPLKIEAKYQGVAIWSRA